MQLRGFAGSAGSTGLGSNPRLRSDDLLAKATLGFWKEMQTAGATSASFDCNIGMSPIESSHMLITFRIRKGIYLYGFISLRASNMPARRQLSIRSYVTLQLGPVRVETTLTCPSTVDHTSPSVWSATNEGCVLMQILSLSYCGDTAEVRTKLLATLGCKSRRDSTRKFSILGRSPPLHCVPSPHRLESSCIKCRKIT